MNRTIEVFVNDRQVSIYRGMKVRHALIAFDQAIYSAVSSGKLLVFDQNGFVLGLDGSLEEGAKIYTSEKAIN